MDLYVLNKNLDQTAYVECFESVVWSLRYAEHGEFELHLPFFSELTSDMMSAAYVFDVQSETAMFVEDVEMETNAEDLPMIIFKGRSLESILARRIIWGKKTVSGKIQTIISTLLSENIINPALDERRISNFVFQSNTDSRFDDYKIADDSPIEFHGDILYDAIKYLCDLFDVGFRVTLNSNKQFVFQLYCGEILDGTDETKKTVTFSPKMDNLSDTRYLQSSQNYKNVTRIDSSYELKAEQNNGDNDPSASSAITAETKSWVVFPHNSEPLTDGLKTMMHFNKKVSAGATLNINGTGAKPIYYKTNPIGSEVIDSSATVVVTYSTSGGGRWVIDSLEEPEEGLQQSRVLVVTDGSGDPISGLDRREIFTDAGSITTEDGMTPQDYAESMRLQGYATLRENCETTEIDGESIPGVNYIFGQDYQLGDIVKVENECGVVASVRIIEYVQTFDENGLAACPSFSSVKY